MDCLGIYMSTHDMRRVFNADLMMRKSWALVDGAKGEDVEPELLRARVEMTVKAEDPHVVVRFIDPETQDEYAEGAKPIDDYALVLVADAPFFSGTLQ